MLLPSLTLLLAISSAKLVSACSTPLDCSLNGECVDGACTCDGAWSGPDCGQLAFAPTDKGALGYKNATSASWGGNVVFEGGVWHLFVAQMAEGCGLDAYGSNSQIVRAQGPSASGPFQFQEAVTQPFAHNPTIRRLPNNTGFVLFFIGSGQGATPKRCDGTSNRGSLSALSPANVTTGPIHVMQADSILGPWSAPVPVAFLDPADGPWAGGGTNPSAHIAADGTVTLALQRTFSANPGKELIGVARASSWKGPYSMLTPAPIAPEKWYCVAGTGEDPTIWKNQRGWHILFHGMCPTGVWQAHHAFSEDAATWKLSQGQAYGYTVQYSDGTHESFARVERPQLVFPSSGNENDAPTHLINGVCPAAGLTQAYNCLELPAGTHVMTWTLARPLGPTTAEV